MAAAEHRQLFSLCLRLPAAYGSNPLQALSKSQAAQLVRRHVLCAASAMSCAPCPNGHLLCGDPVRVRR